MIVEHVEVLVEEPSMEAALRGLLPRLLNDVTFQIYTYQGKSDLLSQLSHRMHGYASFLPATWRVVVVVDRDDDDCRSLKSQIEGTIFNAGLRTPSTAYPGTDYAVVTRIAVEELEAWYFGDWDAVTAAYPRMNPDVPMKAKYRNPDQITGGTWEAFERVARNAGYFKGGLRKVEAAREIGAHLSFHRSTSGSFRTFCKTILEFA